MFEVVPIRSVYLHVTKACNLRCTYCYFSASNPLPDELSTKELVDLWPPLVSLRPEKVIFTGGEPLLRPDIVDLLRTFRDADVEHKVKRCLNTNGQLLGVNLLNQLVGLVDDIRVSLDALPERNDLLRGKGTFDVAMQTLQNCLAAGFSPKALITVTSVSLPDIEQVFSILLHHGITRMNFNHFRMIGRGQGRADLSVDPRGVELAVQRAWRATFPDSSNPPLNQDQEMQSNCGVGSFLNIMPNGDVFPCHVLTNPEFRCGNLRRQHLLEICRGDGILGQLQNLDFNELWREDDALRPLARRGTCMGPVYHEHKSSPAWRSSLVQLSSVRSAAD
jgi:MoaA/NifB/PqqE/SkfB family radical SAM enzyme